MKIMKRLALLFGLLILFLGVFGDTIGKGISLHLAAINNRVQRGQTTLLDRMQCAIFYNSMICLGGLVYPEAADILDHYIYGKGEDLYLEADYIKESPVVIRHLNQMRVGESRTVVLKQHEDWRLSYAVNGFTLKKGKNKLQLSQHILFSRNKHIYTDLNFYLFRVRVPDGLVHALSPTPFRVYAEWRL